MRTEIKKLCALRKNPPRYGWERMEKLKKFSKMRLRLVLKEKLDKKRENFEKYTKQSRHIRECRKNINHCWICGVLGHELILHHIIPLSMGGNSMDHNVVFICKQCHSILHPWLNCGYRDYSTDIKIGSRDRVFDTVCYA